MIANPKTPAESTENRHSLENPSNRIDDYEWGGGALTDSGEVVTHQKATSVPAFWQGVTMLSGDVAKIPLEIYERLEGTDRQLASNHAVYPLVRLQPNQHQGANQFWRQMMVQALVWNNAFAMISRNADGTPESLIPILPDRTSCRYYNGRFLYQSEINGRLEYFDSNDIFHLRGITFDGILGLDTVCYTRDWIGKMLAREGFASKFFKNGGRIGGILQLPWAKDIARTNKKEEGFRKTYENSDSAFKTVILRDNAMFHAAQASFEDTQLVEVGQQDVRTVARILNLPPHKLGAEGATSYSSLEQENKAYNDSSLSPWFRAIESECRLKLFTPTEKQANKLFFEHTIGALVWADIATVAKIASEGVRGGWLKANEGRRWLNLNSVDGGDVLLIPSGMVVAEDLESEPTDEPEDQNTEPAQDPVEDDVRNALSDLIDHTARRYQKRLAVIALKASKKDGFDAWLKENFEVENLPAGRDMFHKLEIAHRAAGGEDLDHASQVLKAFQASVQSVIDSGGDVQKVIQGFKDDKNN